MRAIGLLGLLGATVSPLPAPAGEQFPQAAYVTATDVYVRSGPGSNYYPTDKLQRGDRVEVYRHDPGGWYAVRPPKGSYSWVSARHLEALDDGLGRARDQQVVVRVGSKLRDVRDVVQVRLDRGEIVEILQEHNAGGQTWYKIAPPAGEFRWISGRYLDADPPHDGVGRPGPRRIARATTAAIKRSSGQRETAPEHQRQVPEQDQQQQGWGRRRDRAPARPWKADRTDSPSARAGAINQDGPSDQHVHQTSADADDPDARGTPPTAASSRALSHLAQIEQQLSAMVVNDPAEWEFSELKRAAEILMDQAETAVERGHVRRVLNKIARFEDIRERHRRNGAAGAAIDPSTGPLSTPSPMAVRPGPAGPPAPVRGHTAWGSSAPTLPATSGIGPDFDGVGTLRPVVARRRNAPRYALVDRSGTVVAFVTPGPGVNLQPYLGRRIGIRGSRGYLAEFHRAHVMAQRITALEERVVR